MAGKLQIHHVSLFVAGLGKMTALVSIKAHPILRRIDKITLQVNSSTEPGLCREQGRRDS
jgi:hypothetical protein